MNYTVSCSELYFDEGFSDGISLDLRSVQQTNCYCSDDAAATIRETLQGVPVNALHWIDSGDYHYLSFFFAERIQEPFSLALIDNHPDNQGGAFDEGILSCGNWVSFVEKLPNYRKPAPDIPVYLSIDLDILCSCEFRTNWNQGSLFGDGLMRAVSEIASSHRLLGVDICGGLTIQKGARPEDLALNRNFRKKLIEFFRSII